MSEHSLESLASRLSKVRKLWFFYQPDLVAWVRERDDPPAPWGE
jgi:hypothetical protein